MHVMKVLIVDGDIASRDNLRKALEPPEDINLLSAAPNGKIGLDRIAQEGPDLVVLYAGLQDVSAPEFTRKAFSVSPGIQVLITAFQGEMNDAEKAVEAMEAGAFDFIFKPGKACSDLELERLQRLLLQKIRCHSIKRFSHLARRLSSGNNSEAIDDGNAVLSPSLSDLTAKKLGLLKNTQVEAVLIGVSTGGPEALARIMPAIPALFSAPIVIVQHMPELFTRHLAESLNLKCRITVKEADDGEALRPGTAYLARGGKHLLIKAGEGGRLILRVGDGTPENGCRPSVDVLFRSAASAVSGRIIAIVLTGMGTDGTKGLAELKEKDIVTIVQDEASSVVWGMPGSVVKEGFADEVLSLDRIVPRVLELLKNRRG